MTSFEFEPESWPAEKFFELPSHDNQMAYLRAVGRNSMVPPKQFRMLCTAILEGYGLPDEINQGSCIVLIDYFKSAPARSRRAAERHAWGEYL